MYLPKHFAENDTAVMHGLMGEFPLATLVSLGAAGLEANHIPLHLDAGVGEFGALQGHVALANPLWQQVDEGAEVLAIFHGPACYISPSGYATKAEHGKVVPTWNYVAVHTYGHLRVIHDPAWILAQVQTLTNRHESGLPTPWAVSDAPADYIEKMLGAIKGIEITITRLQGKWKASQNQPPANQASLADALTAQGDPMGAVVRQRNGL